MSDLGKAETGAGRPAESTTQTVLPIRTTKVIIFGSIPLFVALRKIGRAPISQSKAVQPGLLGRASSSEFDHMTVEGLPFDCGDSDMACPGNFFCYSGEIDWVRRDYNIVEDQQVCICDSFYGQSGGPDCDSYSWGNSFSLALYAVFGTICVIPSFRLLMVVAAYRRSKPNKLSPLYYTAVLVMIGLFSLVLRNYTECAAVRSPTSWTSNPFDSKMKLNRWRIVTQLLFGSALVLMMVSSVRIVMQWIDVVRKSKSLRLSSEEGFLKIKKIANVAQFGLLFVYVPLIVLQAYFILSLIALPTTLVIGGLYSWGAVKLSKLLNDMMQATNKAGSSDAGQRKLIESIRYTAVLVIVGLVLTFLTSILYGWFSLKGSRALSDPKNKVPLFLILAKLPEVGLLFIFSSLTSFILKPLRRSSSSTSSAGAVRSNTGGSASNTTSAVPHTGNSVRSSAKVASSSAV